MNYQWYPGHMTKARRMMQEDIKLIDLVIELLDARVPFSSRNPDIDKMGRDKARLIRFLMEHYPGRLTERYGCEETAQEALTVYEEIARRRGCIKKGQELDYTKTGMLLLDDFRSGKLGRITLELPKGETEEQ